MRKEQDQTAEDLKHGQKNENVQQPRVLASMKKSWSTDSISSLSGSKGSCVCAPTRHEGSFRCRHHRHHSAQNMAPPAANPKTPGCIEEEEAK
ncbi:hypothetical protein IHE45_07G086600 [Dioscorea alata]|uniref:Uncharacterized protein n=1 Tax=Dioscorea alata TaxID=55571 RepID=A0ACB7VS43_DIOAL|nr:hypothetical protein IHE45_07G086600 [Dioscorea alata]